MIRKLMMAAVAVCLVWPAASGAQEAAPSPRARSRPRVQVDAGPYSVFAFSDNRGRIGVIVDTHADVAGDKVGARIEAITPGGPAEKAGLKAGDVITRFNGKALAGATTEDEGDSGPGMKLIDLAQSLDPGDTVLIEYRRGNESRKATVIAQNLGGEGGWGGMPGGGMRMKMPGMSFNSEDFNIGFRSPWGGIELVKLNPDLGDYFGAREGILVVSAPRDSTLALKGGDVITTIGGRTPSSPMQAMKILRSYDPGDTVAINVLRKKKAQTVTWVVPEQEDRFYKMAPEMHEEPSWFRLQIPQMKIRSTIRTTRTI
jgi:C-terminal processing protease CtpA/Prc